MHFHRPILAKPALMLATGLLTLGIMATTAEAALRAGVAAVDITRDSPTVPVHDSLFAKALVADDGTTRVAIISLDLGGASTGLVTAVRARLREKLGIEEGHVLLSASHNHHTQGQVAEDVADRIVEAVRRAAETMVPVRVGAGAGREARITMNRRLRLTTGKQWTIRRANPSPKDSQVGALGPSDPEIGVLRLDRATGEPFADVALRIKERSPYEYTFVAGYANGHLGYAPTADAYDDEAYEDALTPFAPEWQGIYEAKALEIIRRLGGSDAHASRISSRP